MGNNTLNAVAYKLTRLETYNGRPSEYIGTFTQFASITYKDSDNDLSDYPPLEGDGAAFAGNITQCDRCPTNWYTSEITKVLTDDDTCIFYTNNSKYKLEKIKL